MFKPLVLIGIGFTTQLSFAGRQKDPINLRRTAAGYESVLETYRQVLNELVPALGFIEDMSIGQKPQPDVPESLQAMLARLQKQIPLHTHHQTAPAMLNAYHSEVEYALTHLSQATKISQTIEPFQVLVRALNGILEEASRLLILLDRKNADYSKFLDPEETLAGIQAALSNLERAERDLEMTRLRRQTLGEQLQAFLRLDLALSHTLDQIALAQESGLELGFDLPISTGLFVARYQAVSQRVQQLAGKITQLSERPWGEIMALRAEIVTEENHKPAIRLLWVVEAPIVNLSGWVLYRRLPNEVVARPIIALTKDRQSYTDHDEQLAAHLTAAIIYELVPVSKFGVEGHSVALRVSPVSSTPVTSTTSPSDNFDHLCELGNTWRHQQEQLLLDENTFSRLLAVFANETDDVQFALLRDWWQNTPLEKKMPLLETWPESFTAEEFQTWKNKKLQALTETSEHRIAFAFWLENQGTNVQSLLKRHWQMLANVRKEELLAAWHWDQEMIPKVSDTNNRGILQQLETYSPLQLKSLYGFAFWVTRDAIDQQQIIHEWQKLDPEKKKTKVQTWFAKLADREQKQVVWSSWQELNANERFSRLESGYTDMPKARFRQFLAWYEWQKLSDAEKDHASSLGERMCLKKEALIQPGSLSFMLLAIGSVIVLLFYFAYRIKHKR